MGVAELRAAFRFPPQPPSVPPSEHGWFGPQHAELLGGALGPATRLVVDLGSYLGKSARFMAERAPDATVVAVDSWEGYPSLWEHAGFSMAPAQFYDTFIKSCWAYRDRMVPVRTTTVSALRLMCALGVVPDLIYLDAAHDYENAKADIGACLELFPNSALCGDDFLWLGVGKALTEEAGEGRIKAYVKRNVWWKEGPAFAHMRGVAL